MKIIKVYLLINCFILSTISFTNEIKFINIKDILKEHYISVVQAGQAQQEFKIKEMIKNISKSFFVINFNEVERTDILKKTEIDLKENAWIIEKIYFIKEVIGNDCFENISPEPKFPREYYKNNIEYKNNEYNKILFLKLKYFYLEIPQFAWQGNDFFSSKISFNIELFLYDDGKNILEIKDKKFKNLYYNIIFIQDTSPLNTMDRRIIIFGVLKEIE